MSKEFPECPLRFHTDCGNVGNPQTCAIVREDKTCTQNQGRQMEHQARENHDTQMESSLLSR
jgi:hypothetical protein